MKTHVVIFIIIFCPISKYLLGFYLAPQSGYGYPGMPAVGIGPGMGPPWNSNILSIMTGLRNDHMNYVGPIRALPLRFQMQMMERVSVPCGLKATSIRNLGFLEILRHERMRPSGRETRTQIDV